MSEPKELRESVDDSRSSDCYTTITFGFDGQKFEADMSFYYTGRCQLPDGRIIEADGWLESMPPQPVNFREVKFATARVV